jgi:hypothetical protein
MEPLGLVLLAGDGERWILPEDRDSYEGFKEPPTPQYALVSSLDSISLLRRDVIGLVDPADLKRKVLGDRGTRELGGLSDLPNHAILDRGRLVGLWEFDPDAGSIVWWAFGAKGKALEQAVARTEDFIRADLGDARSFSLDSPKSRAPRIAALKRGHRPQGRPQ